MLSLGAIDFGIIVDGAIVMLETILKKREDHPENSLEEKSIARRAKEVGRPILFSTIVIITAYLPLFAFERVERKLFTPMAFTMSYAMIGALLVALLLIPGLAYAIYRKPRKLYKNRWLEKLKEKYTGVVAKVVDAPLKAIVPSIVFLVAGIVLSVTVGKDFLPELDEGSIWLQVNLPPGISVEKSREFSDTLRARTMKYPEVTYIMVQAGRNDDGTDPFTPSHFEVSVGIKPYPDLAPFFIVADGSIALALGARTRHGIFAGPAIADRAALTVRPRQVLAFFKTSSCVILYLLKIIPAQRPESS